MTDRLPRVLPPGTAFDITHMISTLTRRKTSNAKAAGNALKELRDALSSTNDFILASELIENIRRDISGNTPRFPASILVAALSQTILLYVRGSEKGSQRKSLKIYNHLSEDQQSNHNKFKNLRNKAIAHLDNDRSYGDRTFLDQKLVLVHKEQGQSIQLAEMRVAYTLELVNDLSSNLAVAMSVAKSALSLAERKAGEAMASLSLAEEGTMDLIEKFPFNAEEFFGNTASANAFLYGGFGPDPDRQSSVFPNWPAPDRGSDSNA